MGQIPLCDHKEPVLAKNQDSCPRASTLLSTSRPRNRQEPRLTDLKASRIRKNQTIRRMAASTRELHSKPKSAILGGGGGGGGRGLRAGWEAAS